MSELRGHSETPGPTPGADRPRPDTAADLRRLEALAELGTSERKAYDPTEHLPSTRESPASIEAPTVERSGLSALRDKVRQAIAGRFGDESDARTQPTSDDPGEAREIQRPSYTDSYYTDLPRAAYDRYLVRDKENPIPLFDGPPTRSDVRQGLVGDCGVLATIGAVAGHRPEAISNAVRQVGDGQYEVTLHKVFPASQFNRMARPTGETTTLRLNDELPVNLDENGAPAAAVPDKCAWPALMEKALAGQDQSWGSTRQIHWETRWTNVSRHEVDKERLAGNYPPAPVDAPTGYDRLNIGSSAYMRADLLAELTGKTAVVRRVPSELAGEEALLTEFRDLLADGKPILVASRGKTWDGELPPTRNFAFEHVYEVTKVEDGRIQLRNPWGDDRSPGPIDSQFLWEYFRRYEPGGYRDGEYTALK